MGFVNSALLVTASLLAGCATSPWHSDLMTNQQLASADCRALASEQVKVQQNAKHLEESSSISGGGAVFMAILDSLASSAGSANTGGQATAQQMQNREQEKAQSQSLLKRGDLIGQLRTKKGCA